MNPSKRKNKKRKIWFRCYKCEASATSKPVRGTIRVEVEDGRFLVVPIDSFPMCFKCRAQFYSELQKLCAAWCQGDPVPEWFSKEFADLGNGS